MEWKLVPIEPALAMLKAARRATSEITGDEWRALDHKETKSRQNFKATRRYVAMVAAAPERRGNQSRDQQIGAATGSQHRREL